MQQIIGEPTKKSDQMSNAKNTVDENCNLGVTPNNMIDGTYFMYIYIYIYIYYVYTYIYGIITIHYANPIEPTLVCEIPQQGSDWLPHPPNWKPPPPPPGTLDVWSWLNWEQLE